MDVLASVAGAVLVIAVWRAAVLTLVVARPTRRPLLYSGWIALVRAPVDLLARRLPYPARDSLLAPVASVVMVSLVPFWLVLFWLGYGLMFYGTGPPERAGAPCARPDRACSPWDSRFRPAARRPCWRSWRPAAGRC